MKAFIAAAFAALVAAAPVEVKRATDAPFGDKKGLAFNDANLIEALAQPGSATWAYNWAATSPPTKFQYIPMMWGPGGDSNGVMSSVKAGSPWVLGYNEPDMCTSGAGGSCKKPQDAYNAWGNDMFKFADAGAKLVCPAITSDDTATGSGGFASGLTWLSQFASIGNNPKQFRCSAQALHWYGGGGDGGSQGQAFISYVGNAHTKVDQIFGQPMDLWITEFSPTPVGDPNVMSDFLKVVIPWLDSQDYVARYSPFMADKMVGNAAGATFIGTH